MTPHVVAYKQTHGPRLLTSSPTNRHSAHDSSRRRLQIAGKAERCSAPRGCTRDLVPYKQRRKAKVEKEDRSTGNRMAARICIRLQHLAFSHQPCF